MTSRWLITWSVNQSMVTALYVSSCLSQRCHSWPCVHQGKITAVKSCCASYVVYPPPPPFSRGRDCCCLGVFHDITSSLFPSCVFAMFILVLSYHCNQYWWQVHLNRCLHIDGHVCGVSSSLQHLWNGFTAEVCHRNWSLTWIIGQFCCRFDATHMQRKAVYLFFFPWGFSCMCWALTVAFPLMTRGKFMTSSNTQK